MSDVLGTCLVEIPFAQGRLKIYVYDRKEKRTKGKLNRNASPPHKPLS